MARYLIAGAGGYVGSRLAERLLQAGHSVRGLVRNTDSDTVQRLAALGMSVWEGDLTKPESLVGVANGIERVYNLTTAPLLDLHLVQRVFVEGNRNLIAACSRSRTVSAYLFTGNVASYGDRGDTWLTEDSTVMPNHPLGHIMVEAEQAMLDLIRVHHFPAMLLRVASIYGPGRDFIDAVQANTVPLIGNGRNFLSHIHIDDLIDVLDLLAIEGQPGAVYNVADDEPTRARDFYGEIHERLGLEPPQFFSKAMALAAGMDPSVVGMASASVRLSNQRITQELGLSLRYPSFRVWLDERLHGTPSEELALSVAI
jgi:nucleoside-diphosphate-sugar epimerase